MFILTALFCRNIIVHHLTAGREKVHRYVCAPVMVVAATTVVLHLPVLLRGLSVNIRFLLFSGACVVLILVTFIPKGLA